MRISVSASRGGDAAQARSHECALSELPDFTALPGRTLAEHHTAGIIMAPSLAYMDQAYLDAKAGGWSKRPIVEMLIPSTLDDSLAPSGRHVATFSVNTSRRCSRTARPGTITGTKWPTS